MSSDIFWSTPVTTGIFFITRFIVKVVMSLQYCCPFRLFLGNTILVLVAKRKKKLFYF